MLITANKLIYKKCQRALGVIIMFISMQNEKLQQLPL